MDEQERRDSLLATLTATHIVIARVLARLPIAIKVIPLVSDEAPDVVSASLERALALLAEEPVPEAVRGSVFMAVLDWLTAFELSGLDTMELAGWRVPAAEAALTRAAIVLRLISTGGIEE